MARTSPPPREEQAIRLRRLATFLLVAMGVVMFASTWAMTNVHTGFVWVQAFAEAALVGGLADWFAVTALFRHPMGLPIPHTAIIPRSKDRIGEALASFLKTNFLTPRNVARRLEGFNAASSLANVLERPSSGGRFRKGFTQLVAQLSQTEAAGAILQRLQHGTLQKLRDYDVSPFLGQMLDAMIADGRHRPVIDELIAWAGRTLDGQEGLIRSMVEERTSWLLRLVNVDDRISNELVNGLRGLLDDLHHDPHHPVREKAEIALSNLAYDLQHNPETKARVEHLKQELLSNPAVAHWMQAFSARIKNKIITLLQGEGLGSIAQDIGQALRHDTALSSAVNQLMRRTAIGVISDHGDAIVSLVSETVKGWDASTVTEKMETAVSRDLQYIRLNGTLIGGSIGLCLHAFMEFARAL